MAQYHSKSEKDTARQAHMLATELPGRDLLCLYGDLGLGKSVFARALIRALTGDPGLEVPSPTFTLLQTYDGPKGPVFHFDLYRLGAPEEIYELGWEEALAEGLVIAEWPERLGGLLPAHRLDIRFQSVDNEPDQRFIEMTRL